VWHCHALSPPGPGHEVDLALVFDQHRRFDDRAGFPGPRIWSSGNGSTRPWPVRSQERVPQNCGLSSANAPAPKM